jgi:hypothetical protein
LRTGVQIRVTGELHEIDDLAVRPEAPVEHGALDAGAAVMAVEVEDRADEVLRALWRLDRMDRRHLQIVADDGDARVRRELRERDDGMGDVDL